MRTPLVAAFSLVFLLLASADQARGQGMGTTSQSGMFGSRTLGQGLTAGTRTMTGSPVPGNMGSQFDSSNVGQVDSSDRFVRGNRQAGAFIGTSAADAAQFLGAVQAGQGAQGATSSGISAAGNRNQRQQQPGQGGGRGGAAKVQIRPRLHVAFSYRPPIATAVSAELARRLASTPQIHTMSPLEVSLVDGTLTLRGHVATEHDRSLAEQLALLEAGVWKVKNELVVAPSGHIPAPDSPFAAPLPPPDIPLAAPDTPEPVDTPVAEPVVQPPATVLEQIAPDD